jgi:uncharacterized metal-binding protein YceD (DUF177 family)
MARSRNHIRVSGTARAKTSIAMNAKNEANIWSLLVSIDEIDETGRHFDLAPDEKIRARLAAAAGVRALPHLTASFDVTRHGRDGLRVTGEVAAIVGQNCVVTLEPMESELREAVDLVFSPRPGGIPAGAALQLSLDAADAPETLDNGVVDLGAVATEFLLLGIDPYPRKADAVFAAPVSDEAANRPFAALAGLKKGAGEGNE